MNQAVILLVEDDKRILGFNERKLKRNGYEVLVAENIASARVILQTNTPDLMVLDVMLPDGSGFDFCKEIRMNNNIPVVFLTGKTQLEDKMEGLMGGGDYYLTKPYDMNELLAVIQSQLRRIQLYSPKLNERNSINFVDLLLDTNTIVAMANGEDLILTPKEFTILLSLIQRNGEPIEPQELYEKVWNAPMAEDSKALAMQVSRLRKKLEEMSRVTIQRDRDKGYYLNIRE